MHRLIKSACAAVLFLSPSIALADYTFIQNFDTYTTGDLGGQNGWVGGTSSVVLTNAALSGTAAGIYGRSNSPADGANSASRALGTTVIAGKIISVTRARLDAASTDADNFDAAGAGFNGIGAYAGAELNNGKNDDHKIRVIRDLGGFAPKSDIIGTDADLLHHWFQLDLTIDLTVDAEKLSVRVRDLDGTYDQTFTDTLNPSFVADTFTVNTSRSGKIDVLPEPSSLISIAGLAAVALCRKSKPSRHART